MLVPEINGPLSDALQAQFWWIEYLSIHNNSKNDSDFYYILPKYIWQIASRENEIKIGGHRSLSRNKWPSFRYFTAKYGLSLNLRMIDTPKPVLIKSNFNIFVKIIILRTTVK